ncbi:hypothetical protein AVEN_30587-1 [Araneus ventricosus]|uniref:Uncharacterized protein n=1 Tax=Araneus ventricosus TaxID=182803 RepID=A0A4Y2ERX0_ARAVE|nr:hypothetical protein AVEN_30587-1 [Araneus ventricosus]
MGGQGLPDGGGRPAVQKDELLKFSPDPYLFTSGIVHCVNELQKFAPTKITASPPTRVPGHPDTPLAPLLVKSVCYCFRGRSFVVCSRWIHLESFFLKVNQEGLVLKLSSVMSP